MNKTRIGLSKLAQEEAQITPPETDSENTVVTCMSDCMYSQNPEKTCMLKNISLAMGKPGEFTCGQYSPAQQAEVVPQEAAPQQLGLSKQPKPTNK